MAVVAVVTATVAGRSRGLTAAIAADNSAHARGYGAGAAHHQPSPGLCRLPVVVALVASVVPTAVAMMLLPHSIVAAVAVGVKPTWSR